MEKSSVPQRRTVLAQMKPYSPGKPIWEVQEQYGLKDVIKLASNENPLGVSPKAKEAMLGFLSEIHRYPDANTTRLRDALADFHQIEAPEIIVGNGADELIKLVSEAFLEAGDEIIIPSPTFNEYEFAAHLMGVKVISVPLNEDYAYNIEVILDAVTEQTKLIYLCSPNNPTGTYLNKNDLDLFFAQLPRHILVILDCAYSHYSIAGDYTIGIEYIKKGYSVFILQTFSKIYGLAGIRVGYGIATAEIIKAINLVKEPFNVNALAQIAATAALKDTAHVIKSQKINEIGREFLYRSFARLGIRYTPSMSNFILVRLEENAKSVYEQLLGRGIIVRYGVTWGLPGHLRITIGTPHENKTLVQVLSEIL
ncbi:MAG: hisC [Bacilli bacterium]|nr:hisC [Bacilli bacterium]